MKTYKQLNEKIQPIDPKVFIKDFDKLDRFVVLKNVSTHKLERLVAKALKPYFMISVSSDKSSNVDYGTVNVNAGYIHDEDPDYAVVELEIMFNPKQKDFYFGQNQWYTVKKLFADALVHEFVHNAQYTARGGKFQRKQDNSKQALSKDKDEIAYYSNPDEIGAFAVNAASELVQYFGKEKALIAIRNYKQIKLKHSPVFDKYINMFKNNSKILKRFIKYVSQYIEENG